MQHEPHELELVRVIKPFRLVDAESYERQYWRADGVALAPGFYVVSWPVGDGAGRYDEDAEFRGPYRDRKAAEDAQQLLAARMQPARRASPRRAPAL